MWQPSSGPGRLACKVDERASGMYRTSTNLEFHKTTTLTSQCGMLHEPRRILHIKILRTKRTLQRPHHGRRPSRPNAQRCGTTNAPAPYQHRPNQLFSNTLRFAGFGLSEGRSKACAECIGVCEGAQRVGQLRVALRLEGLCAISASRGAKT